MEEKLHYSVASTPMNKSASNHLKTSSLFSTARGSSVKISMNSIAKASSVLSSEQSESSRVDKDYPRINSTSHENRPTAISTALGTVQSMDITSSSLSSSHSHHPVSSVPPVSPLPLSIPATPLTFQTAKGKQVKISKEALERAKALFQDNSPSFEYMVPDGNYSTVTPLFNQTSTEYKHLDHNGKLSVCRQEANLTDSKFYINRSLHADQPINRFDKQLAETEFDGYGAELKLSENIDSNVNSREILFTESAASASYEAHLDRGHSTKPNPNSMFAIPKKRPRLSTVSFNDESPSAPNDRFSPNNIMTGDFTHLQLPSFQVESVSYNNVFSNFFCSREYLLRSPILLSDIFLPTNIHDGIHNDALISNKRSAEVLSPSLWLSSIRFCELLKINSSNALRINFENCEFSMQEVENEVLMQEAYKSVSDLPLTKFMKTWVNEQLRWIVWTLASYERKYPEKFFDCLLSHSTISWCLKCRYDVFASSGKLSTTCNSSTSVRKRGHLSAKDYFQHSKNAMSPLQRVAETLLFRYPVVVCFCIRKLDIQRESSDVSFAITDGWWSIPVQIDAGITTLLKRNKLCDGTKLVVFTGTVSVEHRETVLSLSINNIRKSIGSTRLGYCHPKYLSRGISIKSIVPGMFIICVL